MRNGNKISTADEQKLLQVLILPMRNGNKLGANSVTANAIGSSYPTYEEWKLGKKATTGAGTEERSYPTYEEWKL